MKFRSLLLILAFLSQFLMFCGGSKQVVQTQQPVSESPCPSWFDNVPQHPDTLFAAATATSRDLQMAITRAQQQSRANIASQVEVRLDGMNKQFQEETGIGQDADYASVMSTVIKEVVSQTLNGCKAKYQVTKKEGEIWRACVLMSYPIGAANARFLQNLKKQQQIEQRIRATDAFKELDEEVQKYKQEKR